MRNSTNLNDAEHSHVGRTIQRFSILVICAALLSSCATPDQFSRAFPDANRWMTSQNRTIVICLDGTWNMPEHQTNVRQIYQIAADLACNETVIPYYDKGVGSTKLQKIPGGVTGHGYQKNVAQAYRFLCMTWKRGDELVIVGFSRGAYQARLLAGVIDYFGIYEDSRDILKSDNEELENKTELLVDLFRKCPEAETARKLARDDRRLHWSLIPPDSTQGWKAATVSCLGVFDTVATIQKTKHVLRKEVFDGCEEVTKHHRELFRSTRFALHAMALDEFRKPFTLVPFEGEASTNRLRQFWFAGAHSDVGGGYNDGPGLGVNSLRWMLTNLTNAVSNTFTLHAQAKAPCENAIAKLHDEQAEQRWLYPKRVRRQPVPGSDIHPTVSERTREMGYKPNCP